MFKSHSKTARTLMPILFFGGLVTLLIASESMGPTQATTIVVNGTDEVQVTQDPKPFQSLPRCKEDSDCPLPTTYCGPSGKCTELDMPLCDCGQPQVLRCYQKDGKARFLYCQNGCLETQDGAICQ